MKRIKFLLKTEIWLSIFLVLYVLLFHSFPTMDGASHMYSAKILKSLLVESDAWYAQFIDINYWFIPNWFDHASLALLLSMFDPIWSEKIFIILYAIGFVFSYSFMVRQVNPENGDLVVLAAPLIFSFLFHLGFFNFSIGFIFFFLGIGFYARNYNKPLNLKRLVMISLIFFMTFYCNLFLLGFLGLTLGSFVIFQHIRFTPFRLDFKKMLRGLGELFIASVPIFVLVYFFTREIQLYQSNGDLLFSEKIKWMNDFRPAITFDSIGEEIITEQFTHILIILMIVVFTQKKYDYLKRSAFMIVPLLLSLFLLFYIPNDSGAGMMTFRIAHIFFMLLIISLAFVLPTFKYRSLAISIYCLFFVSLLIKQYRPMRFLGKDAYELFEVSKSLEDHSILLSIPLSPHWMEPNFSSYLGMNSGVLVLNNYELYLPWFPLVWKSDFPNIQLAGHDGFDDLKWKNNTNSTVKLDIDYLAIYGNLDELNGEKWKEVKTLIDQNFSLVYQSNRRYLNLYAFNK